MKHYQAVIFDLDGTLLDTLDDLAASCNYALTQACVPGRSREEVRRFVGNGIARLMELAVPDGRENPCFQTAYDAMQSHYRTHNRIKTAPYPGVPELIARLKAEGYALAVVSNKPDTSVKPLVADYFGGEIPVAIGEREGVRRKPAPDTVYEALKELGFTSAEAVYVGDSEVDIATARNAGMDCISVTWGFREREVLAQAGATRYADAPEELLQWL